MSDSQRAAEQYDAMGAAYAAANADNTYNTHYERPAMRRLVGDVAGLDVLDVGCGPGVLAQQLVDDGARLTAADVSPRMVELASARLGPEVAVHLADLASPLTFAESDSYDLVVASLVLHYLRDWEPVLTELRRVLKPNGRLVVSTHHPSMDWRFHSPDDYFALKQVTETWTKGGVGYPVTFWRRPLRAMSEAIAISGFLIQRMVEPEPVPQLQEINAKDYARLTTEPTFLFFDLRRS